VLESHFGLLIKPLALDARVPGSNPTVDGNFSTSSLKALGKPLRLLSAIKITAVKFSRNFNFNFNFYKYRVLKRRSSDPSIDFSR